jgi:uncharacterized protein YndB with AHSA1/START domain
MSERSVTHATFVIERSYPTPPQRVFAAFSDPVKKRRWFAGAEGKQVDAFEMDFRVGGKEVMTVRLPDTTPFAGVPCTNDTTYQDIEGERRIVIAYTMTLGERRISASLATFEFLAVGTGTKLVFTEQAAFFEGADGPQMREEGWRHLLDSLGTELEGK